MSIHFSLSRLRSGLILILIVASSARGQTDSVRNSAGVMVLRIVPHEIVPIDKLVRYPEDAFSRRIEGAEVLQALIDTNGFVTKVVVVKSDDPSLRIEAVRAMKSARFTPALENGKPVEVWVTRTIGFRLKRR